MGAERIRIGVVGLGRAGWHLHCAPLVRHPDFHLVAVADAEKERCVEGEEAFGCPSFRTLPGMLDGAALDAVVIATPTHLHREMAQLAFQRGLDVLLEKPMAPDLDGARAIVRSASRDRRVLSVFFPRRAEASFRHVVEIVGSGRIGRVFQARLGLFRYARRADWQGLRKYGGGILGNLGSHLIDLLLQLVGYDVKRLFCHMGRVLTLGDAEDVAKIVVETRRGVVGEVDLNYVSPVSPYELEVYGTRGALTLTGDAIAVRFLPPGSLPPRAQEAGLAAAAREYPSEEAGFVEEIASVDERLGVDLFADFAHAVRTGAEPFVKSHEALAVMQVVERCRKDAGRIVGFEP